MDDLGSRGALRFGVLGDYYFNDRWSVRSGLSYFSMGASSPFPAELKLDYLNIPINANWHFGITPGFLLKGDVNGEDVKDLFKSSQLAISYGIGYKIEISKNFSILIDGQCLFGVTNIIEDSSDDFTRLNAGSSINIGGVFSF